MHPLLHSLWQFLTDLVIPESLASDSARARNSTSESFALVSPRVQLLQPGDLIIVRTPGTFYRFFRGLAGHKFDHLAIVMENGMFLHVGPPTIRLLPVELLLQENRQPRVFRPKLTDAQRQKLLTSLSTLVGHPYDTIRVYSFIFRLAIFKYLGMLKPFRSDSMDLTAGKEGSASGDFSGGVTHYSDQLESYICTDAILTRILNVSKDFQQAARKLKLDYSTLKSWSINDVTQLNRDRPNLLTQIALPAVKRIRKKVDAKSQTTNEKQQFRKPGGGGVTIELIDEEEEEREKKKRVEEEAEKAAKAAASTLSAYSLLSPQILITHLFNRLRPLLPLSISYLIDLHSTSTSSSSSSSPLSSLSFRLQIFLSLIRYTFDRLPLPLQQSIGFIFVLGIMEALSQRKRRRKQLNWLHSKPAEEFLKRMAENRIHNLSHQLRTNFSSPDVSPSSNRSDSIRSHAFKAVRNVALSSATSALIGIHPLIGGTAAAVLTIKSRRRQQLTKPLRLYDSDSSSSSVSSLSLVPFSSSRLRSSTSSASASASPANRVRSILAATASVGSAVASGVGVGTGTAGAGSGVGVGAVSQTPAGVKQQYRYLRSRI